MFICNRFISVHRIDSISEGLPIYVIKACILNSVFPFMLQAFENSSVLIIPFQSAEFTVVCASNFGVNLILVNIVSN